MQHLRRDLAAAAILVLGTVSGHAQGKPVPQGEPAPQEKLAPQEKPLPAPSSSVMPPVELTITAENGKPVCAPAELRLPANTDVALHVISHADTPVTITAAGLFENGHVLHADGDLVHVASEKGYLIKRDGQGTLRVRTLEAGNHDYACTSTANTNAPFVGKLVLTPPAN